jgi:RNA polymerase sigma-70 factor (ECF subfamily)
LDGIDIGEPDPVYEASDAKRDVATLLGQLPEKQRKAIQLVKLEEKSVRDAAAETGLSESDIKISIHRGLKALMRLMAGEGAT